MHEVELKYMAFQCATSMRYSKKLINLNQPFVGNSLIENFLSRHFSRLTSLMLHISKKKKKEPTASALLGSETDSRWYWRNSDTWNFLRWMA